MNETHSLPAVFISYSRADDALVTRLKDDLATSGIAIWVDREGLRPGTPDWEEALRNAIRAAHAVLLVASPNSRSSRYVKDELRIAEMYQRPVYPFWIAGTQWMDAIPLGWGGTQCIDGREGRYATALHDMIATLQEISSGPTQATAPPCAIPGAGEPRNPYKGLRAFSREDAQDFFGRTTLILALVEALKASLAQERQAVESARLLAVIGPSGSGKSSVVMAGLLPELQDGALPGSQTWVYLEPMVPGKHPLEALGLTLKPHFPDTSFKTLREDLEDDATRGLLLLATQVVKRQASKVVLLVDQFEELFTQTETEDERQRFIELLLTATTEPRGPLLVVLTLRADFYDRLLQYPRLYQRVKASQQPLFPMELDDLRATIEGPAALPGVGLTFEGNLVGDLLFEIRGQVGALPLLQFTLDQLFERRDGQCLTLQAYHEMGGVTGALSQHAEQTYTALPSEEHRRLAQALFLRLMDPGASEQDTTRRRAARSEFTFDDPTQTRLMGETIAAFVAARLLTANEVAGTTTLEVSHEAVLREWKRVAEWLHEAHGDIHIQQALSKDVAAWEQHKRPRDRLYRGAQLKEAQEWAGRNRPSERELTFLRASATRRIQSLMSFITVGLLLLTLAGIAGWFILTRPPAPTRVTTLQDNVDGSLRYCINNAPSGSTITFTQGLRGTIWLTGGNLEVGGSKQLTIRGPGADQMIISGGVTHALIHVFRGAVLNVSGLSFKDSQTRIYAFLYNEGTLAVTNSTVSNNKTSAGPGVTPLGGGIYNFRTGTVVVTNSTISNNSSIGDQDGQGGGIGNEGKLTVTHSTISRNTAVGSSGYGRAGGIANVTGTVMVTNSTFSNNSASGKQGSVGGGIVNVNTGTLMVSNSTFSNNSASGSASFGGGIANVTGTVMVTNSTFSSNSASGDKNGQGGGIDNEDKLTVSNSTFSNNTASGKQNGYGGGILNAGKGTVVVTSSTFSANSASSDQGGQGGGIASAGKLTLTNSTFWHNRASGGNNFGGGIAFSGVNKDSSTIMRFCTLYENTSSAGGGIWVNPTGSGALTIGSNIIAANSAQSGPDISGALSSAGYNLSDNFAGATGLNATTDRQVTLSDLKIDPTLRNNDGSTQTLALRPGSPAIDAVPGQACSITVTDVFGQTMTITTDQRGVARLHRVKNACDSGAYASPSQG